VVLKVVSAEIQHKSEVGGVRVGLADAAAVRVTHDEIEASVAAKAPGAAVDGIMVAPMVSGGVETILGVHADPVFGPTVMFGLGGIFVEVLADVTFRVAPFGPDEAHRMIAEVRGFPMLAGVRGQPPADIEALAEALSRLSVFAAANRDTIEGVDLNPFLVLEKGEGAVALDALVVPKTG
jgi:acyl-CoA synthetase (NDP forming)